MDKSIITVNIFGNEYTIKGVAEPDYIMTLANYLNNKMAEVQESTGLKDVKKIAILAAINISDELFEAKKSIKESYVPNEQLQAIRNKIENLISLIDKELPDGAKQEPKGQDKI
jgi:cell division protein ZapA